MTTSSTNSRPWLVSRVCADVRFSRLAVLSMLLTAPLLAAANTQPEPAACWTVRLADVGWSDVTATTAVLADLLRRRGYEPDTTLLAVPVTFAAMKAGNIDVFLGN